MKLTYWPITHNIVRCAIDTDEAHVAIRPFGKPAIHRPVHYPRWFNMSATIACMAEIHAGDKCAVIEWHDGFIVKTGGELDVEIERATEAKQP